MPLPNRGKIFKFPEKALVVFFNTFVIFPNCEYAGFPREVNEVNAAEIKKLKEAGSFIAFSKDELVSDAGTGDVGVFCNISEYQLTKSTLFLDFHGISRVRLAEVNRYQGFVEAHFALIAERPLSKEDWESAALQLKIKELRAAFTLFFNKLMVVFKGQDVLTAINTQETKELNYWLANPTADQFSAMLDRVSHLLNIGPDITNYAELMSILEEIDVRVRLEKIIALSERLYGIFNSSIEEIFSGKKKTRDKETDNYNDWFEKIKDKISEETREEIADLVKKLSQMRPSTAEYDQFKRRLDTFVKYPFGIQTEDTEDLNKAEKILNENHYGLVQVKDRILEYLAARILNPEGGGNILCFIGPPGTGKTSIGKSIAKAMNRKFVRIALGGVRDEAEIRGHRPTYIGALPGKIIQKMIQAGSENPVFMIDEIDKIGADFRGDPEAALLEVLDPEQNNAYADHYLEAGVDLSKVMFILTGNVTDTIIPTLLDRMMIVEFHSYTEEEKLEIAKKFIIPRQLKERGLTDNAFERRNKKIGEERFESRRIEFTGAAIKKIIEEHAREPGVRKLEKHIRIICEKIAKIILLQESTAPPLDERAIELIKSGGEKIIWRIDSEQIPKYLEESGYRKAFPDLSKPLKPGVAPVLVVYPDGSGDVVFVEVNHFENASHRELIVTGISGDMPKHKSQVIKESVGKALDRAFFQGGVLANRFPDNIRIHIAFSEGSIQKTGPSAGVACFLAIYGHFTNQPIKTGLAVTAVINLVRPTGAIGSIREKSFAAYRSNVKEIILSEKNKAVVEKLPEFLKSRIKFHLIDEPEEALKIAFPNEVLPLSGE